MFKAGQQKQPSGPIRYSCYLLFLFSKIMFLFFFECFLNQLSWLMCTPRIPKPLGPKPPPVDGIRTPGLAPEQWTSPTFLWTTRSLRDQRGCLWSDFVVLHRQKMPLEVNIHRFKAWHLHGISTRKKHDGPGKIRIFWRFFLEQNQELGSSKSEESIKSQRSPTEILSFPFFPLNGIHLEIHLQIPPNLFFFLILKLLQLKIQVPFERQAAPKSLGNFLWNPICFSEKLATGWSQQVGQRQSPNRRMSLRAAQLAAQLKLTGCAIDSDEARTENLDVSENSGTPKSSILIGFSIINHPFWGTPIFGNTHFLSVLLCAKRCVGILPYSSCRCVIYRNKVI